MNARVHIFADDLVWEASVERYILHCTDERFKIASYQFSELAVCNRETFSFDAAIAGAFAFGSRDAELESWGIDLFHRFPGRVVLVSPLWLKPPPESWKLCVCQPLVYPERLFEAVNAALSAPSSVVPSPEELRSYLPIAPSRGTTHHARRRSDRV